MKYWYSIEPGLNLESPLCETLAIIDYMDQKNLQPQFVFILFVGMVSCLPLSFFVRYFFHLSFYLEFTLKGKKWSSPFREISEGLHSMELFMFHFVSCC